MSGANLVEPAQVESNSKEASTSKTQAAGGGKLPADRLCKPCGGQEAMTVSELVEHFTKEGGLGARGPVSSAQLCCDLVR